MEGDLPDIEEHYTLVQPPSGEAVWELHELNAAGIPDTRRWNVYHGDGSEEDEGEWMLTNVAACGVGFVNMHGFAVTTEDMRPEHEDERFEY
jgi:hypothetical protein